MTFLQLDLNRRSDPTWTLPCWLWAWGPHTRTAASHVSTGKEKAPCSLNERRGSRLSPGSSLQPLALDSPAFQSGVQEHVNIEKDFLFFIRSVFITLEKTPTASHDNKSPAPAWAGFSSYLAAVSFECV